MAITLENSLSFVKKHTYLAKHYRNWAVSDFIVYRKMIEDVIELPELQKTWALYLKWMELATSNSNNWYSSTGKSFRSNPVKDRTFRYIPGKNKGDAPTLLTAQLRTENSVEVVLEGVAQCDYFAIQAFAALSNNGPAGKVPRVEKIATPGHNWVIVNRSDTKMGTSDWSDCVVVDYWLLALGIPEDSCICKWENRAIPFDGTITINSTFNPHSQT